MSDINYKKAKKKVKAKKEFYEHLSIYVVMSIFFIVLNMLTSNRIWFIWPMLGWGIGVFFHYLDVFGIPGVGTMSKEWEEKAIQEELERMERETMNSKHYGEHKEEPLHSRDKLELKDLDKMKEKQPRWNDEDLV